MLCLFLTGCLTAVSEELPLFPLYEGEDLVGSCVLFASDTLCLTTSPIKEPDAVRILTPEGMVQPSVFSDTDGLLSILIAEQPLPGVPLVLSNFALNNMSYTGLNASSLTLQGLCQYVAYTSSWATLTAGPGLVPGAVITDPDGGLTGLITASCGEGVNRYFALTSEEIYARLTSDSPDQEAPEDAADGFLPVTTTVDHNRVTLTWEGQQDTEYCVYWYDTANSFYSYYTIKGGQCDVHCVPGRSYRFFVRDMTGLSDSSVEYFPPEFECNLSLPEAEKATDYDFLDTEAYLAWAEADTEPGATEKLPAFTDLADFISHDGIRLYFQITSTYVVDREITCDLTCALIAPDGSCCSTLSGFVYGPEYMTDDVWHIEITELVDTLVRTGSATSGTYRLSYYLDDKLASEITFDVP